MDSSNVECTKEIYGFNVTIWGGTDQKKRKNEEK